MDGPFHDGELAVQERAGVRGMARRIGGGIGATIPRGAGEFLGQLPFVIAASVAADGSVWASILAGEPGFLRVLDERRLALAARPGPDDPLGDNLAADPTLGLLAIDLASRRRLRLNGRASRGPAGLLLETRQVFGNCPKYIQSRAWATADDGIEHGPSSRRGPRLTAAQRDWIARADTFFIATAHPSGGADASHRGGAPGFVQVVDDATLLWPDYAGNNMFQTLGNLAVQPRAGLLVVDFERGHTLQLTGRARVIWEADRVAAITGAERLVEFAIDAVLQVEHAIPLRWRFIQASPFNPS
jgi:hypothetical protein